MDLDQSLDIKQESIFDRIVVIIATGLFTLNILLVSLIVLGRQVAFLNVQFLQPLTRYSLVIAVYFGAAVASRNSQHISIEFLLEKLGKGRPLLQRILSALTSLAVTALLVIAILAVAIATLNNWGRGFPDTNIVSPGHVYLGIFIGLTITMLYESLNTFENVKECYAALRDGRDGARSGGP